mgnify:CR=1 FL=1
MLVDKFRKARVKSLLYEQNLNKYILDILIEPTICYSCRRLRGLFKLANFEGYHCVECSKDNLKSESQVLNIIIKILRREVQELLVRVEREDLMELESKWLILKARYYLNSSYILLFQFYFENNVILRKHKSLLVKTFNNYRKLSSTKKMVLKHSKDI